MSELGRYDVCIVGAGLIGLGVATALADTHPGVSMLLLDKEPTVAAHQSSHNSGVVHSGLYYKPGSLKAKLCVDGRSSTYEICEKEGIPYRQTGKLVIATEPSEVPALDELERRGKANGLKGLERIGADQIREIEPGATGIDALHVPESGVADFPALARHLAKTLSSLDARIVTGAEVTAISHENSGVTVIAGEESYTARILVNCAGLHSDRVARLAGANPSVRIVPFRGEYYRLAGEAEHLVKALIYPVPDPRFPFLGVHFTRRIDGSVEVGPNAVLAMGREHYRDEPADWRELRSIVAHRGFRRLAMRHLVSGTKELLNSRSRRLYARLARRLVPALEAGHLIVGGAGVRAQAVDLSGNLVDDFVIERTGQTIHVLNAPSPGATASIAIGRHISREVSALFSS